MGFQGEFNNTIDAKGRASVPARFREVLNTAFGDESLKITQKNGALLAYPLSEWRKIQDNVGELPAGPRKDDIYRVLIGPAQECPFDKQGRIQIPQALRTYAGLDKEREVVVVGLVNKIEIWSQSRHALEMLQSEERLKAEPQSLADLGF